MIGLGQYTAWWLDRMELLYWTDQVEAIVCAARCKTLAQYRRPAINRWFDAKLARTLIDKIHNPPPADQGLRAQGEQQVGTYASS